MTVECRELSLADVRALPPIPSGYTTDRVFHCERRVTSELVQWTLQERPLLEPLHKEYDDGEVDDWIEGYQEGADPGSLRFLGAFEDDEAVGLLTWTHARWNNTLWLADIRVKRDRRRRGTGSTLVRFLQRETPRSRARGIRLETQLTNLPAIQFYSGHGFEITGLDDHLYSNRDRSTGEIALFMFWECP